jgi:ubiquinone/menaquinone biosynthesis C-methylase UbiE
MNHADHVRLIAGGITEPGGLWADMGSGDGAFTLALRDIAGPDVEIVAVDTNQGALRLLSDKMYSIFPDANLHLLARDMTQELELRSLNGIIAANSLHYVERRRQSSVLRNWRRMLRSDGRLIIVEYDTDDGNRWVPFPFSLRVLGQLAAASGFSPPELLGRHASHFMNGIYAASLSPSTAIANVDD